MAIAALALGACTGADPVAQTCGRMQECNVLRAGVSVQDCIDTFDQGLDQLTSAEKRDAERALAGCLASSACDDFVSCVDNL